MTTPTPARPDAAELQRIALDTLAMLARLSDRVDLSFAAGDAETVRWLHRRILSVERDAQTR